MVRTSTPISSALARNMPACPVSFVAGWTSIATSQLSRAPSRPPMWSASGWLTTTASMKRTPRERRSAASTLSSNPPSTSTVAPEGAWRSMASPCPTSIKVMRIPASAPSGPRGSVIPNSRAADQHHREYRPSSAPPPAPGQQSNGQGRVIDRYPEEWKGEDAQGGPARCGQGARYHQDTLGEKAGRPHERRLPKATPPHPEGMRARPAP